MMQSPEMPPTPESRPRAGSAAPLPGLSALSLETADPHRLLGAYQRVRAFTQTLTAPLEPEDTVIQTMDDVSPTKWHLAHTSWFFETFILAQRVPGYVAYHPRFAVLFNSYYNAVGAQWSRCLRGHLSRPTLSEVWAYRRHVDGAMATFLQGLSPEEARALAPVLILGLNHEQQHQELILTDIKHVFALNPLCPTLRGAIPPAAAPAPPLRFLGHGGGLVEIGADASERFAFDNEGPRHTTFLKAFELANRPVTNGELRAFMEDGGYRTPTLWLSEGWATLQSEGLEAPLYWFKEGGLWWEKTLGGPRPVDPAAPACHVSYFEADAFAQWAGARLPSEVEWELVAREVSPEGGRFAEDGVYHPQGAAPGGEGSLQLFGDVWEWTRSPYAPYPGFKAAEGALGEYNGKFMCNQLVLRGGSCATPRDHIRSTYRNFFPPGARWQFTGFRLARDL